MSVWENDLKYSTATIVKYDVETRHCFVFTIIPGFGNQYDLLSSGSLLYSGNARPILKVAVSSDYILVSFIYGTRMTQIIQMITDYKHLSLCG